MCYNKNFDNCYNFDSRNNNNDEKNEKHDCKKGFCTVKVIQECCYPSYWDYEDKKDDKHNDCNKNEDKNEYCCKHEDKKEERCCCKKEDKWQDNNSCHQDNRQNCKQRNSCCRFCSCFRRW